MKITAFRLAELAEKSPGYHVTLKGGCELTRIQFRRKGAKGRRDRFVVEGLLDGKPAVWNSDTVLDIED